MLLRRFVSSGLGVRGGMVVDGPPRRQSISSLKRVGHLHMHLHLGRY